MKQKIFSIFFLVSCMFAVNSEVVRLDQISTVTLIGTNDIRGAALPFEHKRINTNQSYTQGGLSVMASLINILKQQNPGNSLYLDSGEHQFGRFQSSSTFGFGEPINKFFDLAGLDGSAVGVHAFQYNMTYTEKIMRDRKVPYISSNIRKNKTQSEFLPNQKTSKIYTLQNGIKIGVVGLTSTGTKTTTQSFLKGEPSFQDIDFQQMASNVEKQSKKLKEQGANAIVLIGTGNFCVGKKIYGIRTSKNTKTQVCTESDLLAKVLQNISEGSVDVVFNKDSFTNIQDFYKGKIPIIGSQFGARSLNAVYLKFKNGKIWKSFIEGPIPVCEKIFSKTNNCNPIKTKFEDLCAGKLVNWKFHKKKVVAHVQYQRYLNQVVKPQILPFQKTIVQNKAYLERNLLKQTEFANLFGYLGRLAPQLIGQQTADICVLTSDFFMTQLFPGPITFKKVADAVPYDGTLAVFDITVPNLFKFLFVVQNRLPNSFYTAHGLTQNVVLNTTSLKRSFAGAKWQNGTELNPLSSVRCVFSFELIRILSAIGGFQITNVKTFSEIGFMRDIFAKVFPLVGTIKQGQYIDPEQPTLIVQQVK